jgi:predicted porin
MKKSLLAIAAMTAFAGAAQAQSSVTIYGVIDTAIGEGTDKVNLNGTTTTVKQRTTGSGKDGLASSRLGIRGTEDLGGGTSASFVWEQGLVSIGTGGVGAQASRTAADADISTQTTGAFLDARQVYAGVADKAFGELRLGRQATGIHNLISGNSAGYANNVAGALYSSQGSVQNSSSSRPHDVYVNRMVNYITPSFSGVQAELQVSSQTANSETSTTAAASTTAAYYGARVGYKGVKNLNVDLAYSAVDLNTVNASDIKKTVMGLGANYNFGIAQAFGLYTKANQKLASGTKLNDQTAWELGVRAPVTKTIDVFASYLGGSSTGTGSTSASTLAFSSIAVSGDVDISGFQLGGKYNMSKRTSLYAVGGTQSRKGKGVSSASKNEATQVALGLNHTF